MDDGLLVVDKGSRTPRLLGFSLKNHDYGCCSRLLVAETNIQSSDLDIDQGIDSSNGRELSRTNRKHIAIGF